MDFTTRALRYLEVSAGRETMRATTSFAAAANGYEVLVQQGQCHASDHPVVKAHSG